MGHANARMGARTWVISGEDRQGTGTGVAYAINRLFVLRGERKMTQHRKKRSRKKDHWCA